MHRTFNLLCVVMAGGLLIVILAGLTTSDALLMPVAGASGKDWNKDSFWHHPWGRSGVHKGIDIFAASGTPVISSVSGIVLYKGHLTEGGNVIAVLSLRGRVYYYAHLRNVSARNWQFVRRGRTIGTVGDSGNAKGKPPHLHFAVITTIPHLWKIDSGLQGWKKMFYLNPDKLLNKP